MYTTIYTINEENIKTRNDKTFEVFRKFSRCCKDKDHWLYKLDEIFVERFFIVNNSFIKNSV